MAYGYADHLYPVLVLHAILFPVNALRLMQFQRLVREMRDAHGKDLAIEQFLPFMTRIKRTAGATLVRKGEKADSLYYLAHGELEVVEIGKMLKSGAVIGEIGVFAPNQVRTATVVCRTECVLFELSESKAKQLYFQDQSFGFAVLQLVIARMVEYNERLAQPAAPTA
jgi:CRP/FNR family cyclic AMP-dependent transcriptional regulator